MDSFTLLFSALCHDVGHTGRTNSFEINVMSKLAIRYNDRSVIQPINIKCNIIGTWELSFSYYL